MRTGTRLAKRAEFLQPVESTQPSQGPCGVESFGNRRLADALGQALVGRLNFPEAGQLGGRFADGMVLHVQGARPPSRALSGLVSLLRAPATIDCKVGGWFFGERQDEVDLSRLAKRGDGFCDVGKIFAGDLVLANQRDERLGGARIAGGLECESEQVRSRRRTPVGRIATPAANRCAVRAPVSHVA